MRQLNQENFLEVLEIVGEFVKLERERLKKGEEISKNNLHRLEMAQKKLRDFLEQNRKEIKWNIKFDKVG